MALLFADGFDSYTTLLDKWDSRVGNGTIDISASYGRMAGSSGLRIQHHSEGVSKSLGVQASTLIAGFAFKVPSVLSYACAMCSFSDAGTRQIGLWISSDLSTIAWDRNGTNLVSIAYPFSAALWYYIEAKVVFSSTVGRIITKINNVEVDDTSSLDTANTANNYGTAFVLGSTSTGTYDQDRYFDDVYVCDTVGSYCNDFLNDRWIETIYPTGAGTTTQWSPSAGANWDCVEEHPPTTTEYVETGVLNEIDTYACGNLTSTSGDVAAVVINHHSAKTTAGSRKVSGAIYSDTDSDVGTENDLSTTYHNYQSVSYLDPHTAAAWTIAGVNAAEFGVKLTT